MDISAPVAGAHAAARGLPAQASKRLRGAAVSSKPWRTPSRPSIEEGCALLFQAAAMSCCGTSRKWWAAPSDPGPLQG